MMRGYMGIVRNRYGVHEARKKVPKRLEEATATLARAEALIAEKPLRASLTQAEIDRMAELHYANVLAGDEEERREGTGSEPAFQSAARQLADAGIEFDTPFHIGSVPEFLLQG